MKSNYKYDVAISFAEEDRNAALALALALEIKGNTNVYYYPDKLEVTVGKKIGAILPEIYASQARYAVVLLSDIYLTKKIAQIELKAIRKRMLKESGIVYLIIVKLDEDVSLAAYPDMEELFYLSWNYDPKAIADTILGNLGEPDMLDKDKIAPNSSSVNIKTINQKNIRKGNNGNQKNTATIN